MSNLEKYIEKVKKYFNNNQELTEPEKIMYVYLDLGKKFKFDQNFYFGNSKQRKKIYESSNYGQYLEKSFENNTIICKSCAHICQHIFSELGIKCLNKTDIYDDRKYKHVYNIIIPKDGSESYSIDLQNDIENIKFRSFTKDFGISTTNQNKYVISRKVQEKMHKKFGYISKEKPYIDEYIYLLKNDIDFFESPNEKIDFILQNIDPEKTENVDYWERRWKHDKLISSILSKELINKNLYTLEVYKKNGENKKFYNSYYILEKGIPQIYMYSENDFKYNKISIEKFADMINNDGFVPLHGIPKLKSLLKQKKLSKKENYINGNPNIKNSEDMFEK